jgi:hypothetical protein
MDSSLISDLENGRKEIYLRNLEFIASYCIRPEHRAIIKSLPGRPASLPQTGEPPFRAGAEREGRRHASNAIAAIFAARGLANVRDAQDRRATRSS